MASPTDNRPRPREIPNYWYLIYIFGGIIAGLYVYLKYRKVSDNAEAHLGASVLTAMIMTGVGVMVLLFYT